MSMPPSPQQELVFRQESSNRLIQESNVSMSVETQPKILLIKMKSDLKNSKWVEDWIVSLRGGNEVDENLIRSILSKVEESDLDVASINKILLKLGDSILSIASNEKLLRFLSELEKPFESKLFDGQLLPSTDILGFAKNVEAQQHQSKSSSSVFAEGFTLPGLPRRRKKEDFMNQLPPRKSSTPSAYSIFDSTRCYANREAYNMPREVTERFESKAVRKLAKTSLKNPALKKEYASIQKRIEAGIHPVNIGKKSTFVSADKVLIKAGEGRYLVEVGETKVDILGFTSCGDSKSIAKFKNLMNKMYDDVDLQYSDSI